MSNILTADITKILNSVPGSNLIVTVGNSFRADDGVGPYIGENLKQVEGLKIIEAGINPENIVDEVIALAPQKIFIFDAADFGGKTGQVRLIPKESIPESSLSTHAIPLNVITELISSNINTTVYFIGIQPADVSMQEKLSAEVKESADAIILAIKQACSQ